MEHLNHEEEARMLHLKNSQNDFLEFEKQKEKNLNDFLEFEKRQDTEHLKTVSGLGKYSNEDSDLTADVFKDAASKPDKSFKRRWLRMKPHVIGFFFKLPLQIIYVALSALILKLFGFKF